MILTLNQINSSLTYHLLVNLVAARNAMALRLSKSVTFPSKDSLSGVSLTVFLNSSRLAAQLDGA